MLMKLVIVLSSHSLSLGSHQPQGIANMVYRAMRMKATMSFGGLALSCSSMHWHHYGVHSAMENFPAEDASFSLHVCEV